MNKLNARTRAYILQSLCEGMSQRSCERIFGVSLDTVQKLFREAGDAAIAYLKTNLRDLTCRRIQADELHSFVAAKDDRIKRMAERMVEPPEGAGTAWTYLALDADTKLIISYHVGDRSLDDATLFMEDLADRLKRKPNGDFEVRPQLTTDGLAAYKEAVSAAFAGDVEFGMLIKQYEFIETKKGRRRVRYKGAIRDSQINKPNLADMHTSYIERQNLNLRMGNRRFTRRSNAFSKTLKNHERHIALWIMYHNLYWIPHRRRVTAAMEAGIETRLWEMEHFLAWTDAYTAAVREEALKAREIRAPLQEPEQTPLDRKDIDPADVAPFWINHSLHHRTVRIHRSSCSNCRDGQGRGGAKGMNEWMPFLTEESASIRANELEPDHRIFRCSMCLGSYRKRGP